MVVHGLPDTAAVSNPAALERLIKDRVDSVGPNRGPGTGNRAVLVEYSSSQANHKTYALSRQIRQQGVSLTDELTPKQQQAQKALDPDRIALRSKGFRIWFRHGTLWYLDQGVPRECKQGEAGSPPRPNIPAARGPSSRPRQTPVRSGDRIPAGTPGANRVVAPVPASCQPPFRPASPIASPPGPSYAFVAGSDPVTAMATIPAAPVGPARIAQLSSEGHVLLAGDFNAHVGAASQPWVTELDEGLGRTSGDTPAQPTSRGRSNPEPSRLDHALVTCGLFPAVQSSQRRYQSHLHHSRSKFAQREVVDVSQLLRTNSRNFWQAAHLPNVLLPRELHVPAAWDAFLSKLTAPPAHCATQLPAPHTPQPPAPAHSLNWPLTLAEVEIGCNVPQSWKTSLVTPVFKHGDATDTANYRPISVGEPISRLYANIMVQRLVTYTEQQQPRFASRTGYRPELGTIHPAFALQHAVDKHRHANKPLYLCFVDLKSAYDKVQWQLLWGLLQRLGVHGNMLGAVQSLYNGFLLSMRVDARVHLLGSDSPLSATLFGIFIDELHHHLQTTAPAARVQVDTSKYLGLQFHFPSYHASEGKGKGGALLGCGTAKAISYGVATNGFFSLDWAVINCQLFLDVLLEVNM
ncbi:MAG: hypothetical protein FRX49_08776 [Trebouxia sp. A1-2]|nr:MAG: hypothetical protein FRX49_08776 [Trebouxia sp. A1-2]